MSGECDVCGQNGCVEINHCAFKAEIDALTAEVERLNAELASGKFKEGAACSYCSASGAFYLADNKALRSALEKLRQRANTPRLSRLEMIDIAEQALERESQ